MPELFRTPGVIIKELPAVGPIQAVGTSTAAFVGPAVAGPMRKPAKLTSFDQFIAQFGAEVEIDGRKERSPYSAFPRMLYMPYAVRGFFDNGGSVCYVVRVGNAVAAGRDLEDGVNGSAQAGIALRIEAKKEGPEGNDITVDVKHTSLATAHVTVAQTNITTAAKGATKVVVAALDGFQPGDKVVLTSTSAKTQTATVERLRDDTQISEKAIFVRPALNDDFALGTIAIVDLQPKDRRIHVDDTTGIERGSILHIAPTGAVPTDPQEDAEVVNVVRFEVDQNGMRPGFVTLKAGLQFPYALSSGVDVTSQEFTLVITGNGGTTETFEMLSMHPDHSHFYGRILNGRPLIDSNLVAVLTPEEPSGAPPPLNIPKEITAIKLWQAPAPGAARDPLSTRGKADDLLQLDPSHFFAGIDTLEKIDDVNILCVPDVANDVDPKFPPLRSAVQTAMVTHCEKMFDRVAIIDPAKGRNLSDDPANGILGQRNMLPGTPRGFAAFYYPQIVIQDPKEPRRITIPPSGHIAGIYARSDETRGVHKAPANEPIRGALALEKVLTDAEQGELNILGVNVLRVFPGSGPMVWGARTISEETAWRYISTRRLFLFIEESIQKGTRFAVFEPNNLALWATIKRNVTAFLTSVWRDGALFGTKAEEAFYVKVDEENNPPESRALGQVFIEVGLLPVFPAEFVVFRIQQLPGGITVTES